VTRAIAWGPTRARCAAARSSLLHAEDLIVLALVAVRSEGVRGVEVAELVAVVLARLVLELRDGYLDLDGLDVLLRNALLQTRVALALEVLVEQPGGRVGIG
jgi:hypothetical protein